MAMPVKEEPDSDSYVDVTGLRTEEDLSFEETKPFLFKKEVDTLNDVSSGVDGYFSDSTDYQEQEDKLNYQEDEEEEEEEIAPRPVPKKRKVITSNYHFTSDFDIMMDEKRKQRYLKRRRKKDEGITLTSDDDSIQKLIDKMKGATMRDLISYDRRQPAIEKRKLLPEVKLVMLRPHLVESLIEHGMMNVLSDWLALLADKSLPSLEIRSELLTLLHRYYTGLDTDVIKRSGIGRAVMMLFKHPKETKENKKIANSLIRAWSRPIFNLDADYRSVSREERERQDQERMSKAQRIRIDRRQNRNNNDSEDSAPELPPANLTKSSRARPPKVSKTCYVVRPTSTADSTFKQESKVNRFEKIQRRYKAITKTVKPKSDASLQEAAEPKT